MSIAKKAVVLSMLSTLFAVENGFGQSTSETPSVQFTAYRHDAGQSRVGPGGVIVPPDATDPAMLVFARRISQDFDERQPAVILAGRIRTTYGDATISVLWQSSLCEQDAGADYCPGLINVGPRVLYQGQLCTSGEATYQYADRKQIRSCEKTIRLAD